MGFNSKINKFSSHFATEEPHPCHDAFVTIAERDSKPIACYTCGELDSGRTRMLKTANQTLERSNGNFIQDLRFFPSALMLLLGLRLLYAQLMLLLPDEAYYWVWTRHLSTGYFDHPPMIAYIIWIGTRILGDRELGVRLIGIVMALGIIPVMVWLARRIFPDNKRAVLWVALIWLTSPMIAALGSITTPDTPVMFFSACGLACAVIIARRDEQALDTGIDRSLAILWLLFGLFCGLAMLSKYTGVLLPAAVAAAFLFSQKGRRHFRAPGIYVAMVVALAVFWPVIQWNRDHHWVSFLFQLNHGTSTDPPASPITLFQRIVRFFRDIGMYLGDQAFVWTPVLFVLGIFVLGHFWKRYRTLSPVDNLLLWAASIPLALFGIATILAHHTEPNWPCFAYVPLSLLTIRWLDENWSAIRRHWTGIGINVALAGFIGMHVVAAPPFTQRLLRHVHVTHQLQDLLHWRDYGRWLGNESQMAMAPVITNSHGDAGEASFYMPGQPDVWCVGIGDRPSAFDYFDEQPDFARIPAVVWVGGNVKLFMQKYNYAEASTSNLSLSVGPPNPRGFIAYVLTHPQR